MIAQEGLKYTQPKKDPPAFDKFLKIQPVVQDTSRVTNMSDVTLEQGAFNVNGRR